MSFVKTDNALNVLWLLFGFGHFGLAAAGWTLSNSVVAAVLSAFFLSRSAAPPSSPSPSPSSLGCLFANRPNAPHLSRLGLMTDATNFAATIHNLHVVHIVSTKFKAKLYKRVSVRASLPIELFPSRTPLTLQVISWTIYAVMAVFTLVSCLLVPLSPRFSSSIEQSIVLQRVFLSLFIASMFIVIICTTSINTVYIKKLIRVIKKSPSTDQASIDRSAFLHSRSSFLSPPSLSALFVSVRLIRILLIRPLPRLRRNRFECQTLPPGRSASLAP